MIQTANRMSNLHPRRSSVAARLIVTSAIALVLATLAFVLRPIGPHELPSDARALAFVDRNGLTLGTILGRDDRHTIAVPLDRIAPAYLAAVRASEDRRFVRHGAIDPLAAFRALVLGVAGRRFPAGASTLSMQLARLLVPVPATPYGKFVESLVAMRLENGLSKAQILEAYANRAPMGSNIYGVEAAARTYFGTEASRLDLAQAALLAGLPNDPARLDPYRRPAAARARARNVLDRMLAQGAIDGDSAARASRERLDYQPRAAGIVAAAHALFFLAPRVAPERERVRTTLDLPLQRFVEAQVRDVVARLAGNDVEHAAAIVADNATGDVLAYVGSPDYFSDRGGRNDGVQALRQPGSTLKPFAYELALERRVVRPTTILADVPVAYALPGARIYRPLDYADRFTGPVRVRTALADSLNVPAVRVLEDTGVPAFLDRLHAVGFGHLRGNADFYGLGLTLGSGEVSLYELARAYATLERGGVPTALSTTLDGSVPPDGAAGAAAHDPAWSFVTDVLADPTARAAAFGTNSILSLPFPAAVKTGTSSDFRDTWTVGFSRRYTVAVWVGNFDGRPMRGISGVTGAGPLWNRIMLYLHRSGDPPPFDPPRGYARRAICATTGTLPDAACPAVVTEWLDARDRLRLARAHAIPAIAGGYDARYDAWLVGQPERSRLPTRILFPHDGDRFVRGSGTLLAEIAGRTDARVTLDGRALASDGHAYVVPLREGRHRLIADSPSGSDAVEYVVGPPLARGRPGFSVVP